MQTLQLKNGQTLGYVAYEILSVPSYAFLSENQETAQQANEASFFQLLTELYRYCPSGSAVFELLWSAQPVENSPYKGQIHLYFVVRMIAGSKAELEQRISTIQNNAVSRLRAGGFQIVECDMQSLQRSGELPAAGSYVNGIIKAEQCTVHAQSMMPYYYAQPMPLHSNSDFSMLSRTMADLPGSAVSFQLFPDTFSPQEAAAITEMYSMLNRVASGGVMIAPGTMYQDPMAQAAKEAYAHIYGNLQQPLFRYSILAFGSQSQCAALSAQIVSLLKGESASQFATVNLNAERISMGEMFAYYPWNLNAALVRKYRNMNLWQAMQSMQMLFRVPYLITSDEATAFFRLPIDNKKIAGVKSREIIQHVQNLDSRTTNPDNIQIGRLIGDDEHESDIGCPPKTLTKHALVVGMPGTGKTTFSVHLLLQVCRKGIPFLAIEPTKTEYRAMIDMIPDLQIFTPGNNGVSPFVINPFIPPKGITVEQFVPSLASAFKAAFSMPSPLDAIFQQAIQEAYVKYGWRDYSTAQDPDVTMFGLHEFILVFKKLIENSKYGAEVKGNLQSGGVLRLRNLIEQNANIYDTTKTVPLEDLLSRPTVLELNAIDNEEQKSVLIALLLINICVYTKHNNIGDGKLKNLILIDEAHVIFKAQSRTEGAQGGSTAIRSLENMLAEIRSYGTSIVIADQSPAAVGSEVVKNTDVKVAFRLVDSADRKTIAETTNMETTVERQIPKLNVGQAFVSYEFLKEPVLVQTPDIRDQEAIRLSVSNHEVHERMNYWLSHDQYLIPFGECACSEPCKQCSLQLRSDASFYAARFMQDYGAKINDISSLCAYLKAVDAWMERQTSEDENHVQRNNCVKIRLLRRIMLQKDIPLTASDYKKVLKTYLNQE